MDVTFLGDCSSRLHVLVASLVLLLAGVPGFWMLRHAFAQRRNAPALVEVSEARPEVRWYLFGGTAVLIAAFAAILIAGWLERPFCG
jgi:hypothetical protein